MSVAEVIQVEQRPRFRGAIVRARLRRRQPRSKMRCDSRDACGATQALWLGLHLECVKVVKHVSHVAKDPTALKWRWRCDPRRKFSAAPACPNALLRAALPCVCGELEQKIPPTRLADGGANDADSVAQFSKEFRGSATEGRNVISSLESRS